MSKSSFYNLYSLGDASKLWHVEESVLRRAISRNKLVEGEDVKKFGKQWVVKKEAMQREYGSLDAERVGKKPDKNKEMQILYYASECLLGYCRHAKKTTQEAARMFSKFNIWQYIYECYDYLHLGSISDVIADISSRIKRGIVYA